MDSVQIPCERSLIPAENSHDDEKPHNQSNVFGHFPFGSQQFHEAGQNNDEDNVTNYFL